MVKFCDVLPTYLPVRTRASAADAAIAAVTSATSAAAAVRVTRDRLSIIDSNPFGEVVLARQGRGRGPHLVAHLSKSLGASALLRITSGTGPSSRMQRGATCPASIPPHSRPV